LLAVSCIAWLGVVDVVRLRRLWCINETIIVVVIWPAFQCRYLTLKALLLLVEIRQVCDAALFGVGLAGEFITVSGQLAVPRLHLRYLLLKRIVHIA
jgi:hypothetical protein